MKAGPPQGLSLLNPLLVLWRQPHRRLWLPPHDQLRLGPPQDQQVHPAARPKSSALPPPGPFLPSQQLPELPDPNRFAQRRICPRPGRKQPS